MEQSSIFNDSSDQCRWADECGITLPNLNNESADRCLPAVTELDKPATLVTGTTKDGIETVSEQKDVHLFASTLH